MLLRLGRLEQIVAIVALSLLAIGCVLVLRPFITPILWAAILVFATWPIYGWLLERLRGRRGAAAALMTLLLAAAFLLPLMLVGTSIAENGERFVEVVRETIEAGPPELPAWVAGLPVVGPLIAAYWGQLAGNTALLGELVRPLLGPLRDLAVAAGLAIGGAIVEVSLSVLISFFLYRDGLAILAYVEAVGRRIAGERMKHYMEVVTSTVLGVVYGIIGTAIAQGGVAALGFLIAGLPAPFFLGFLTFILALFPAATPLVWVSATIYLLHVGEVPWAIFMALWGFFVISGIDNFIRPYLISRGTNLSFIVVLLGVVGGILAFGFLGIFLGPTLLAVGLAILREWIATELATRDADQRAAAE